MIEAFFGSAKAVGIGVLVDQPGSFLVLATLGLLTAARFSGDRSTRPMAAVVRVLRFPPFIAMLAAIALSPWPYPHAATTVLTRLADTLAPVALVAVGLQVRLVSLRSNARPMALALCYKMVAAPACIALLLMLTGLEPGVAHVTTFEAAMPPMITGGIVAIEHDLNPTLVALVLGVSIPLAFVTLPIWRWILGPA
jgi:predicted permease